MDWRDHRFEEMAGHPVELGLRCDCTRVLVGRPAYFIDRLGAGATPRDAERRMVCRACGARPRLSLALIWSVAGGRDRRPNQPPLPEWIAAAVSAQQSVYQHDSDAGR
ncbi:hypothetical protein J2Y54_000605 [Sphingomonas sp. BE123]|uniref:hypothetical protein n=1 Tax=Sphingomonas sp. BE123 TaxID=2817842 RepID=UPI00285F89A9|nr:hypothetical protein [Sphingomonas sp. BE123]MDR6851112.1 hypothetical protein [Sphingomonas sp. BE123]